MKKSTYITTRFDVDDEFYVEVSPNGEWIEFVLCKKKYGLKDFMFGLHKKDCPEETWEEIIENNAEDYITSFPDDVYDVFESGFLEEHGFWEERKFLKEEFWNEN